MYYHLVINNVLNSQLSEFVPPERIYHEIGRYVRAGATEYFLALVSDVRMVPLTTECAMRMVRDAKPYLDQSDQANQDAFLRAWSGRQFGQRAAGALADLYREYFSIPGRQPRVSVAEAFVPGMDPGPYDPATLLDGFGLVPRGDNAPHAYLRGLNLEALPLLQKDQPLSNGLIGRVSERLKFASTNRGYYLPLLAKAETLAGKVQASRHDFYQSSMLTSLGFLLYSNEMLERYCRALQALSREDRAGASLDLDRSLAASDAVFAALRWAERGKWAGWYIGEYEVGVEYSREAIRTLRAAVRGEPAPPIRKVEDRVEYAWRYQKRFRQNFPLLYGPKSRP